MEASLKKYCCNEALFYLHFRPSAEFPAFAFGKVTIIILIPDHTSSKKAV